MGGLWGVGGCVLGGLEVGVLGLVLASFWL